MLFIKSPEKGMVKSRLTRDLDDDMTILSSSLLSSIFENMRRGAGNVSSDIKARSGKPKG